VPIGPDGWFEGGRPIEVEGGIKARSTRGRIGEQWWSRRFTTILEAICAPGRLQRGRAYARKGQVLEMSVAAASVTARVQGSRETPYDVRITIPAYGDRDWSRIQQALAASALYRAQLLAGAMPPEIVEVFAELGLPLFPDALDMTCSCPDWGVPCKHASAVLYLLAEAFDDDPFLVLAWRGRDRDTLLDALRGTVAAEAAAVDDPLHVDDVPLEDLLADFYAPTVSLGRLRELPGGPAAPPELLLRALDPPPVKVRHIPLVDLLKPAYRALADDDQAS
jgi:uncharacterized Zn finger protein